MTAAQHLVQVGLMGQVGLYHAVDFSRFERNTRVICRTERGLEVGTVVCCVEDSEDIQLSAAGQLLRKMSDEDQRIVERLERYRDKAFEGCQRLLHQRGLKATLIDVEHLFDGKTVYFYFLGEVPAGVAEISEQLTAEYESKVRFKKFAETLANGCGPGCGTKEGGCSSGGCGSCSLTGKCAVRQ